MFLTIRIDEKTKQLLKQFAKSENRTMSKQALLFIEQCLNIKGKK